MNHPYANWALPCDSAASGMHVNLKRVCNSRPGRDGVRMARHFSAGKYPQNNDLSPIGTAEFFTDSVVPAGTFCCLISLIPGTEVPGYSHCIPPGRAIQIPQFGPSAVS